MITYQKMKTEMTSNKLKEIVYSLDKINEEKAFEIIPKYLIEYLGCNKISQSNFVVDFIMDFSKDGIIFRYIYEEGFGFFDFCSPNHRMESDEYYEKLEKIVKDLVELLNKDNHILNIAE